MAPDTDSKIVTLAERETEFSYYSISTDGDMVWLDLGLFSIMVPKSDFELLASALDQIFTAGARGVVMEGKMFIITITPSTDEDEGEDEAGTPNHYHVTLGDGVHDLNFVIPTKEFPLFLKLAKTAQEKLALQPSTNSEISK